MTGLRLDLALVAEQVPSQSRVLDLGCGTGSLLAFLQQERTCSVTGVEIDPEKVLGAIRRGVPVIEVIPEASELTRVNLRIKTTAAEGLPLLFA